MPVELANSQELIRVFFYGTLKRNQPNDDQLLNHNVTFVSEAVTEDKWPLVVASDFNVPFLLDHKGYGKVYKHFCFLYSIVAIIVFNFSRTSTVKCT